MTVEELETSKEYTRVNELHYADVVPFVIENIKKRTWSGYFFFGINFLFLLVFLYMGISGIKLQSIGPGRLIGYFLVGLFLVPLPLIPVHEAIHALVYWLFGARNIRFGLNKEQFYFYVAADRHITGFGTMIFVALSPFLLVSAILFLVYLSVGSAFGLILLAGIFSHGIMCIGDFAMLAYYLDQGADDLVSFDKVEEKKAYFYKRIP